MGQNGRASSLADLVIPHIERASRRLWDGQGNPLSNTVEVKTNEWRKVSESVDQSKNNATLSYWK